MGIRIRFRNRIPSLHCRFIKESGSHPFTTRNLLPGQEVRCRRPPAPGWSGDGCSRCSSPRSPWTPLARLADPCKKFPLIIDGQEQCWLRIPDVYPDPESDPIRRCDHFRNFRSSMMHKSRIADPGCLSRIRIFPCRVRIFPSQIRIFHSGPEFLNSGFRIRIDNK